MMGLRDVVGIDHWKLAQKFPEDFLAFVQLEPDNWFIGAKPLVSCQLAGPFKLFVPSLRETLTFYANADHLIESQSRFRAFMQDRTENYRLTDILEHSGHVPFAQQIGATMRNGKPDMLRTAISTLYEATIDQIAPKAASLPEERFSSFNGILSNEALELLLHEPMAPVAVVGEMLREKATTWEMLKSDLLAEEAD